MTIDDNFQLHKVSCACVHPLEHRRGLQFNFCFQLHKKTKNKNKKTLCIHHQKPQKDVKVLLNGNPIEIIQTIAFESQTYCLIIIFSMPGSLFCINHLMQSSLHPGRIDAYLQQRELRLRKGTSCFQTCSEQLLKSL